MQGINYEDISRVYSGVYAQPQAPQMVDDEDEEEYEETEPVYNEPEVYAPPPQEPPMPPMPHYGMPGTVTMMHTVEDDPVRDLLKTAAGFAIGWKVADYLGMFSKGRYMVGNQSYEDMSDERVAEYRRQGLLPPSGY